MRSPGTDLLHSAVTLAAALSAAACAVNPATGSRELSFVSESQEIAMGKGATTEVASSMGLYGDSALQQWMQRFGASLAARSERPTLPWSFRVVDEPVVNAFALPGGFIYVTRGILAHINSEAELAGVVGHEIGHVTARHAAQRITKQQLATAGLVVGSIASSDIAQYANVAGSALGILFLKYSRDDERQADDLGLRYMRRAGFDARQMPAVFTMLERVNTTAAGGRVPQWLATHPDPGNRRERIAQEIATLPPESLGTRVNRDLYLHRIEGLVFGADPRDGYFKGSRFTHPALRFQIAFPEGWTTSNLRQSVLAVAPTKDALVEVKLAPEANADLATRTFLSQAGMSGGFPVRQTVHGLPAAAAAFALTTDAGSLLGTVVSIEHEKLVFRLVAYARPLAWAMHQAEAEGALASFAPLADSLALRTQPQRLTIMTLERRSTIAALARERPSPVAPATLALINQVETDTPLDVGTQVKWVVGQPPP
jgi:predicted Zn-dependent protease